MDTILETIIKWSHGQYTKKVQSRIKSKIVLEVLPEENTLVEISNKYEVSQQIISRWKSEFLANMPSVFDKEANETEKLKNVDEILRRLRLLRMTKQVLFSGLG